jgi:Flp pilus assembly protein TadD
LRRSGLTERTVVVVVGDHGEALGEHGEPTHGVLLYEASLRVPLLLSAPGLLPPGWVVEEPIGLADLAPTLATLVGHSWTAPHDGRDLARALRDREEPPRADLYAETLYPTLFGWSALASLRRGDRKAIAAPRPELYDLGRDPAELANLWREGEEGDLLARLEALRREAAPAAAPAVLDAETRAKLESLGYVAPAATPELAAPGGSGRATGEAPVDPKDRIALFRELETARQEMEAGQLAAAVGRLEPIVEADPANPVFRGTLAEARRRRGEREEAIVLYREAVAANPADTEGWYNLAVTLQEAGRPAEAVVALSEALRRAPEKPEAVNALGVALSLTGRHEEARAAFARATELDPRNAKAWNNLGNVLRDLGRLPEAEAAYRRSTELAPGYPDPWNGLGTLAVQAKRPTDALPLFDRALALGPQLHEVLLNRAIALELAGDPARAAEGYRAFLAATAGGEETAFSAQREAARRLLARLDSRT